MCRPALFPALVEHCLQIARVMITLSLSITHARTPAQHSVGLVKPPVPILRLLSLYAVYPQSPPYSLIPTHPKTAARTSSSAALVFITLSFLFLADVISRVKENTLRHLAAPQYCSIRARAHTKVTITKVSVHEVTVARMTTYYVLSSPSPSPASDTQH